MRKYVELPGGKAKRINNRKGGALWDYLSKAVPTAPVWTKPPTGASASITGGSASARERFCAAPAPATSPPASTTRRQDRQQQQGQGLPHSSKNSGLTRPSGNNLMSAPCSTTA